MYVRTHVCHVCSAYVRNHVRWYVYGLNGTVLYFTVLYCNAMLCCAMYALCQTIFHYPYILAHFLQPVLSSGFHFLISTFHPTSANHF